MKQLLVVIAALAAGFVGGILGVSVMHIREQSHPQQVIRARSFELVDKAGQTISFWGIDKGQNAVLAFGSRGLAWEGARPDYVPHGLENPHNQLTAFGLQGDDAPLLKMSGTDGKERVSLYLSPYGKPFLLMADETGPRVALGINQSDTPGPQDNDWALTFLPDRAWIGMYTVEEGGQKYVRGLFSVSKDKVKSPERLPN